MAEIGRVGRDWPETRLLVKFEAASNSLYLPLSPCISLYLPVSPSISLYLPLAAREVPGDRGGRAAHQPLRPLLRHGLRVRRRPLRLGASRAAAQRGGLRVARRRRLRAWPSRRVQAAGAGRRDTQRAGPLRSWAGRRRGERGRRRGERHRRRGGEWRRCGGRLAHGGGGAAASWQSAAAVAAAGAEGWQREGPHVGERLVRRMEEHGDIRALVRLYLPPGEGEEEPALWRVEHADGEMSRDWPRSAESGREWPRLAEIARRRRQRGAGAARGCGRCRERLE